MKKHINLFVLFFYIGIVVHANTDPNMNCCGTALPSITYDYGDGGLYLPSIGEINVLLVFAEFKDDTYDTNAVIWPKGDEPQNMSNWIDQTWTTNPTEGSLTHYFNEMSSNKLKLTGKEIHIITSKTRHQYDSLSWKRGNINKELIQQIDNTESFADFDNWTMDSSYAHRNVPDGKVEMIIMVWRNIDKDSASIGYKSSLGFSTNYADLGGISSYTVDGGVRYINNYYGGSGVTLNGYLGEDPFRIVVHEFAHYLLGNNTMHNGFGFWGMLADWGTKSYTINAFELYQLQWAILSS